MSFIWERQEFLYGPVSSEIRCELAATLTENMLISAEVRFKDNNFYLNDSKTLYMFIQNKPKQDDVTKLCYLEVILDSCMSWRLHCIKL